MKIHIVQRNDSFQSIANKYDVSVQDLIGMNTHINHLTGLVPGLKVKVPSQPRKDESSVDQHIQKYYPNLDAQVETPQPKQKVGVAPIPVEYGSIQPTEVEYEVIQPIPIQKASVVEAEIVPSIKHSLVEDVEPIPLKPLPGFDTKPKNPNDGVKAIPGKVNNAGMQECLVMMQQFEITKSLIYPSHYPLAPMGSCGAKYYQPPISMRGMAEDPRLIIGAPLGGFGVGYGGFGYPYFGGFGYGFGYPYYGGYMNPYWGYGQQPYYSR